MSKDKEDIDLCTQCEDKPATTIFDLCDNCQDDHNKTLNESISEEEYNRWSMERDMDRY